MLVDDKKVPKEKVQKMKTKKTSTQNKKTSRQTTNNHVHISPHRTIHYTALKHFLLITRQLDKLSYETRIDSPLVTKVFSSRLYAEMQFF